MSFLSPVITLIPSLFSFTENKHNLPNWTWERETCRGTRTSLSWKVKVNKLKSKNYLQIFNRGENIISSRKLLIYSSIIHSIFLLNIECIQRWIRHVFGSPGTYSLAGRGNRGSRSGCRSWSHLGCARVGRTLMPQAEWWSVGALEWGQVTWEIHLVHSTEDMNVSAQFSVTLFTAFPL